MKSSRRACRTSRPPAIVRRRRLTTQAAHRAGRCRVVGRHEPQLRERADPALYAGGFHDFMPDSARRHRADRSSSPTAARSCSSGTSRSIRSRRRRSARRSPRAWARCPRAATTSFTFNGTAGQVVEIFVDADDTTTGTPNPDLTFALLDPNGNEIQFVDTGTNPGVADSGAAGHRHVHGRRGQLRSRRSSATSCIACRKSRSPSRCCRTTTCCSSCRTARSSARSPSRTGSPTGRSRSAALPGTTLQMVDRARQHAGHEEPQRRGPHPLRRLRRRESAGVLQLSRSGDVRSQLGARRQGRRGLCVLRAVRARGVHFARTVDDLLRQEQQALQAAGDPAEARHGGDGRREHDVLRRATRSTIRIRSRTSSAPAQRRRMQRRSRRWCSMRRAGPGKVKPKKMRKILQDSAFRHDLDPFFSSGFALSRGKPGRDQRVRRIRTRSASSTRTCSR